MRVDVVSIFPEYLDPLRLSLAGRAQEAGLVDVRVHDLRSWAHDRHRTVDDAPYGGGAGMVMTPGPWGDAFDDLLADAPAAGVDVVVPTPAGRRFTQVTAQQLSAAHHLLFACGRYEGIDQRVLDDAAGRPQVRAVHELSLGDYVLNGGEVAALAMLEAVLRLQPGFLGNPESLAEESHGSEGLLEYPVYTRPVSWRGREVPSVLLGGDHQRVAAWRRDQARRRTAQRRPDLLHPGSALGLDGARDPDAGDPLLELRAAVAADAPEILVLQLACWVQEAHDNPGVEIPALHENLDDVRGWLGETSTLTVRAAHRLVGAVRGRRVGDRWEVGRLMVAPDLRGRGLGRRLLAEMEAAAPPGVRRLCLVTGAGSAGNLAMYRRTGYRPDRVQPEDPGVVHLSKPVT